ncbi:lytic transglycosylase domain-containing protein [Pseudoxanthomonas composti]|uniref:LysM peptidoglycan-binding domain-containing protein n=1 Tax=Pseudoxanthomonas composti TaxID=2137479 RepID=A0A4Q1JVM9_9GAMM|nr:lytic transglycosylase domain-containing protein [Pseudoxanthomonas composti]RXR05218.1 LysM peptidoglycan-binding domain-containing protein [Pseudoxanthomonas composti]
MRRLALPVLVAWSLCSSASALETAGPASQPGPAAVTPLDESQLSPDQRNGAEIFQAFRNGLAAPQCESGASQAEWEQQFRNAPRQLADGGQDALAMFGYVVDALRDADLPTEFALIPFVESAYKPSARNGGGPAGLWQFIALTARNHGVRVGKQYDGRMSPVDSTQAAVRYLKTLHGMFGGDWRLTVMAYNAGEARVLTAMRRAGMSAATADPARLPGMSRTSYQYVEKLHALACLFQRAENRPEWVQALERPVPRLAPQTLPEDTRGLEAWARGEGHDPDFIRRINPALWGGNVSGRSVLAPTAEGDITPVTALSLVGRAQDDTASAPNPFNPTTPLHSSEQAKSGTSHTVRKGESAWSIAKRYGIGVQDLLTANHLGRKSVIKPGMVLTIAKSD